METLKLKAFNTSDKDISAAAQILKNGGVVAIPTETVYGLAANALDTNSVKKIFASLEDYYENMAIERQINNISNEIPTIITFKASEVNYALKTMFKKSYIPCLYSECFLNISKTKLHIF